MMLKERSKDYCKTWILQSDETLNDIIVDRSINLYFKRQ